MAAGAFEMEGGIGRMRGEDEPVLNKLISSTTCGIGFTPDLVIAKLMLHIDQLLDLVSAGSFLLIILQTSPSIRKLALDHTLATKKWQYFGS